MIAYTAQTKDPTRDSALIDEQHAEYRWVGYALVCIGSFFSRFFNTFHSSTDSGRIPRIPAGIQEFRGIPGIPEDSGRNRQESNWNGQRICLFTSK